MCLHVDIIFTFLLSPFFALSTVGTVILSDLSRPSSEWVKNVLISSDSYLLAHIILDRFTKLQLGCDCRVKSPRGPFIWNTGNWSMYTISWMQESIYNFQCVFPSIFTECNILKGKAEQVYKSPYIISWIIDNNRHIYLFRTLWDQLTVDLVSDILGHTGSKVSLF